MVVLTDEWLRHSEAPQGCEPMDEESRRQISQLSTVLLSSAQAPPDAEQHHSMQAFGVEESGLDACRFFSAVLR